MKDPNQNNNASLYSFVTSKRNIYRAIYALESYINDPYLLSTTSEKNQEGSDLELYYKLLDPFNWEVIEHTIDHCRKRIEDVITNRDELFETSVFYVLKKLDKVEVKKNEKKGEEIKGNEVPTAENGKIAEAGNKTDKGEEKEEKIVLKYRPLHTASLIDQICMVAMLQILMFEDSDEHEPEPPEAKTEQEKKSTSDGEAKTKDANKKNFSKKEYQRNPSDLSKSIPANFYGNKCSVKMERIYQYWVPNYQSYNKHIIESTKNYAKSHEYDYEITLDIKNFFPSISPVYLYEKICEVLNERFSMEEDNAYKKVVSKGCKDANAGEKEKESNGNNLDVNDDVAVLRRMVAKLLFLKIKENDNVTDSDFAYYGEVGIEELSNPEKEFFAMGVAQGLPQSYFFGNICMTDIRRKVVSDGMFKGKDYFYVDDSVIYVSKETLRKDDSAGEMKEKGKEQDKLEFQNRISQLNKQLIPLFKINDKGWDDLKKDISESAWKFHKILTEKEGYKVEFHANDKSRMEDIDKADVSQIELEGLARDVSGNSLVFDLEGDESAISYEKMKALDEYVLKMMGVMKRAIEDDRKDKGEKEEEDNGE